MARDIAVVGLGYVGLIAAVGLADFGNRVVGTDIDRSKLQRLRNADPVLHEPGLREYLQRNLTAGRLRFTDVVEKAIAGAELVFLAVGTPALADGAADLSQVREAVRIVSRMCDRYRVLVTKSTVPVGTNRWIVNQLAAAAPPGCGVDVVSNPEFLREGKAIQDFFHPDKVVIGYDSEKARALLAEVYRPLYLLNTPFVWCSLETAELIKYAVNGFLATKITYINQIANLAEATGADVDTVATAMGMDRRISPLFLHPGPGYGGSCLPKDTRALVSTGEHYGVEMGVVRAVIRANLEQRARIVAKLEKLMGDLRGRVIAVLGLAFKAGTDDARESPSIQIIEGLCDKGCTVRAHDPMATESFKRFLSDGIGFAEDSFEAVRGANAVVFCTDWNEYRNIDLGRMKQLMAGDCIVDARNVLDTEAARSAGFRYMGVGR